MAPAPLHSPEGLGFGLPTFLRWGDLEPTAKGKVPTMPLIRSHEPQGFALPRAFPTLTLRLATALFAFAIPTFFSADILVTLERRIESPQAADEAWYLDTSWGRNRKPKGDVVTDSAPREGGEAEAAGPAVSPTEEAGGGLRQKGYHPEEVVTSRFLWQREMALRRQREQTIPTQRERREQERDQRERREREREKAELWKNNHVRLHPQNGKQWELNKYLKNKKEEIQELLDWRLTLLGDTVHDGSGLPVEELEVVKFKGRVEGNTEQQIVIAVNARGQVLSVDPKNPQRKRVVSDSSGGAEGAASVNNTALDAFKVALDQRPETGAQKARASSIRAGIVGKNVVNGVASSTVTVMAPGMEGEDDVNEKAPNAPRSYHSTAARHTKDRFNLVTVAKQSALSGGHSKVAAQASSTAAAVDASLQSLTKVANRIKSDPHLHKRAVFRGAEDVEDRVKHSSTVDALPNEHWWEPNRTVAKEAAYVMKRNVELKKSLLSEQAHSKLQGKVQAYHTPPTKDKGDPGEFYDTKKITIWQSGKTPTPLPEVRMSVMEDPLLSKEEHAASRAAEEENQPLMALVSQIQPVDTNTTGSSAEATPAREVGDSDWMASLQKLLAGRLEESFNRTHQKPSGLEEANNTSDQLELDVDNIEEHAHETGPLDKTPQGTEMDVAEGLASQHWGQLGVETLASIHDPQNSKREQHGKRKSSQTRAPWSQHSKYLNTLHQVDREGNLLYGELVVAESLVPPPTHTRTAFQTLVCRWALSGQWEGIAPSSSSHPPLQGQPSDAKPISVEQLLHTLKKKGVLRAWTNQNCT